MISLINLTFILLLLLLLLLLETLERGLQLRSQLQIRKAARSAGVLKKKWTAGMLNAANLQDLASENNAKPSN